MEIKDVTEDIDIFIRSVKDVEYTCPNCKRTITSYDVDCGEYNEETCKCGQTVKFFVSDWMQLGGVIWKYSDQRYLTNFLALTLILTNVEKINLREQL